MDFYVCKLLICLLVVIGFSVAASVTSDFQVGDIVHTTAAHGSDNGVWKKRVTWKARWVQEWKVKTTYIPFWKKIWAPVEINEWIPKPILEPKYGA